MSEKVNCGHPECEELAKTVERALGLGAAFAGILDPLIRRAGPEAAAVILRGFADRVERVARSADRWNAEKYAELNRESALAGMDS